MQARKHTFVRNAYYGGATDYYLSKLVDGKYYDVNSLYPFALLNYMPLQQPALACIRAIPCYPYGSEDARQDAGAWGSSLLVTSPVIYSYK